jgi:hypothetical protein
VIPKQRTQVGGWGGINNREKTGWLPECNFSVTHWVIMSTIETLKIPLVDKTYIPYECPWALDLAIGEYLRCAQNLADLEN